MKSAEPRLLLITTKFPPSIGGMQTYMHNLFNRFGRHMPTYKIVPGPSLGQILPFLPYAVLKGVWMCRKLGMTHLLIGDASLAPIGYYISHLCRVKPTIAVHGLDITAHLKGGQRAVARFMRRYKVVVCNSHATKARCIERGVDSAKCVVVPCGVELAANERRQPRDQAVVTLGKALETDLTGKTVLVNVGRVISRKGVAWFVEHVVPRLSEEIVFVVAGDGPELSRLRDAVRTQNLSSRVHVLGGVSDEMRDVVYDAAQAFIMPNIRVSNDMEGFGIVMLEAGVRNVPVVASDIEGITDALIEGITGTLVKDGDPDAFVQGILEVLSWDTASGRIREAVGDVYGWERVYRLYAGALGVRPT